MEFTKLSEKSIYSHLTNNNMKYCDKLKLEYSCDKRLLTDLYIPRIKMVPESNNTVLQQLFSSLALI